MCRTQAAAVASKGNIGPPTTFWKDDPGVEEVHALHALSDMLSVIHHSCTSPFAGVCALITLSQFKRHSGSQAFLIALIALTVSFPSS